MIISETFKSKFGSGNQNVKACTDRIDGDDISLFKGKKITQILNHRAAEHPFLNNYAKKGLLKEKRKFLHLETLGYFKNLSFYICAISALTFDESMLRLIIFNAQDELGKTKSCFQIYRDFLIKNGISSYEVDNYKYLPSTAAFNEGISDLYSTPPLQKAMGALFADKVVSANIAAKYNEGLTQEGLSAIKRGFWICRMEVDADHSNAVFNVMENHLQNKRDRDLFSEGIKQYMYLMEVYLDGIQTLIEAQST